MSSAATTPPAVTAGGVVSCPLFLASVTFTDAYRCFAAGDRVEFRPGVNLVVGDQGAGKSSLLAAIVANSSRSSRSIPARLGAGVDASPEVEVLSFDFERDNVRTQSALFADPDKMARQLSALHASHGEAVWGVLEEARARATPAQTVVVLDEPDLALSPRSARRLAALFAEVAGSGSQVIAAVHNPIVIAAFADVYSAEHRRWMPSAEFLAAHADPATSQR